MISRDVPMALVVLEEGEIKTVCFLGYATLDGNEMHRINMLVGAHGCYAHTIEVGEQLSSFEQLFQAVKEAVE